jgi:glutamate dehydrogenase (NAD(P)+)
VTIALEYADPENGVRGWLAYDGLEHALAAGGCRVQRGLAPGTLETLASRMTLKERVLGVNVDGAKCGLDLDPASPEKGATLRRFLAFLREELESRFSMGCDMGTQWHELEQLAAIAGIPSIKVAVQRAQGLPEADFRRRLRLLDEPHEPLTLGERRAGHALAHAAIRAARTAIAGPEPLRCALHGFGTLGRAAACSLAEEGIAIVAVADEYGCVADPGGLDVRRMLATPYGTAVAGSGGGPLVLARDALFELPCDLLVIASVENAVAPEQAASLAAPTVVVGSNCGLASDVEDLLHRRGVLVIPDFVGGIGGSASMEILFGSERALTVEEVLHRVGWLMSELVDDLIERAERQRVSVREVALALAASRAPAPGERPYGCSPFATTTAAR